MTVAADTKSIESLRGAALKQKYKEVFGTETKSNNRPFLVRKIVEALESRPSAAVPEPKELAEPIVEAPKEPPTQSARAKLGTSSKRDPRLPEIGTVLEREHGGKNIRVKVLAEGFEFRGKVYPSLSAVANEATGTTWNGFLFFRLIPYAKRAKKAA